MPDAVASFAPSSVPTYFLPDGRTIYDDNSGFPGAGLFIGIFLIAALIAIGMAVYRVSTARRIAQENGLDPDMATRVAFLNDNAVTATYLASNIKRTQAAPPPAAPVRSVKARLVELQQLHDAGDITDEELAEGRKHIINGT
jgi:hypothetical protein